MTTVTTSRSDDIKRWMALERELKTRSVRYHAERAERLESTKADDTRRIAEIFDLFDYDKHRYLPAEDLPMVLKAIGCDDKTCAATRLEQQKTFTLEDLMPVALAALAVGRDGFSDASTREAFRRFSSRSYKKLGASASSEDEQPLSLNNEGLKKAFAHCGAKVSDDDVAEILLYADLDGDGVVGEEDWVEVMRFVVETQ